jgi:hypothetical protein
MGMLQYAAISDFRKSYSKCKKSKRQNVAAGHWRAVDASKGEQTLFEIFFTFAGRMGE